jgi:hypothetical protein
LYSILIDFIPLGIAAISPTMILLVTALLPARQGPAKALAVVGGRYVMHLILALVFLYIFSRLPEGGDLDRRIESALPLVYVGAGAAMLATAVWFALGSRAATNRISPFEGRLSEVGPASLFAINAGIVLVSFRLMALVFAGTALIEQAELREPEPIVLAGFLALAMVVPLLAPIGLYGLLGSRRHDLMARLRLWMTLHLNAVNVVVLSVLGVLFVIKGAVDWS